jgi:hypothetical protein
MSTFASPEASLHPGVPGVPGGVIDSSTVAQATTPKASAAEINTSFVACMGVILRRLD